MFWNFSRSNCSYLGASNDLTSLSKLDWIKAWLTDPIFKDYIKSRLYRLILWLLKIFRRQLILHCLDVLSWPLLCVTESQLHVLTESEWYNTYLRSTYYKQTIQLDIQRETKRLWLIIFVFSKRCRKTWPY